MEQEVTAVLRPDLVAGNVLNRIKMSPVDMADELEFDVAVAWRTKRGVAYGSTGQYAFMLSPADTACYPMDRAKALVDHAELRRHMRMQMEEHPGMSLEDAYARALVTVADDIARIRIVVYATNCRRHVRSAAASFTVRELGDDFVCGVKANPGMGLFRRILQMDEPYAMEHAGIYASFCRDALDGLAPHIEAALAPVVSELAGRRES